MYIWNFVVLSFRKNRKRFMYLPTQNHMVVLEIMQFYTYVYFYMVSCIIKWPSLLFNANEISSFVKQSIWLSYYYIFLITASLIWLNLKEKKYNLIFLFQIGIYIAWSYFLCAVSFKEVWVPAIQKILSFVTLGMFCFNYTQFKLC